MCCKSQKCDQPVSSLMSIVPSASTSWPAQRMSFILVFQKVKEKAQVESVVNLFVRAVLFGEISKTVICSQ